MPENFFSKAKADGQVFMKTMTLGTKLGKLKIEINKKERERERTIKAIGSKIVEMYEQTHTIDAPAIQAAVIDDLNAVQHMEEDIAEMEAEIEQTKADFRANAVPKPQQGNAQQANAQPGNAQQGNAEQTGGQQGPSQSAPPSDEKKT